MSTQLIDAIPILNAIPGNHLILLPDAPRFTIVGATDSYLGITYTSRGSIQGKGVFEVFTDDTGNMQATGVVNLSASLHYVVEHLKPHQMAIQRYAVHNPRTGRFEEKIWKPENKPVLDSLGRLRYIIHTVEDITEQVRLYEENQQADRKLAQSESRFRMMVEQAPIPMAFFSGPRFVISLANERVLELWDRQRDEVMNKPLFEALPEFQSQGFDELLMGVYRTGKPYVAKELSVTLKRKGRHERTYIDFVYEPFRESDGTISGVTVACLEITDQVLARQKVVESEQQLRSLVEGAPFPIGVYVGREMRIQFANQAIMDIWGKGNDVIGRRYAEVLPELENQQIFAQLDQVYTTGQPFHAKNQRVDLQIDGELKPFYFHYSFTPLHDAQGQVYGVGNTAADITDLALAKQQVENVEAALRVAIELAELGTWEFDAATGQVTYSDRVKEWFGITKAGNDSQLVLDPIHPDDRERVKTALIQALQPGSDGLYEEEYRLINLITGVERIIHSQGLVYYDDQGKPLRISGTAQDVTTQRRQQQELERQVAQRTQELQASVADLRRSNENLQQFAYVASHDLQEPLRKIQSFGDLLIDDYGDRLGEGVDYLKRMQSAAWRMSTLIKDLLSFSRISTRQDTSAIVSLNQVVESVLSNLDLVIGETAARVEVDPLPTIRGDASQLGQLFQNLLGNALKFRRDGVPPHIRIKAQWVPAADLPASVRPTRLAEAYHCLEVSDNGIGFDEKYIDRIFQVFQRLHGKSQYAGTGIGLAICEKVATNHGGAITARSEPGEGATFSVYFPA